MTTSAARRRRNTAIAAVLAAMAAVVVVGITAVGASSIANSRAGRDATIGRLPEVRLPDTPTGLLVVVDDAGRPTSMAVLVIAPGGTGGSIVPVPLTADSTLNLGDDRFPLIETFDLGGVEPFLLEVEAVTALEFDVIEFATRERLAEVLGPLGRIEVELTEPLVDDRRGEPVLDAGAHELTPLAAAEALVATDRSRPDHVQDPARSAIWRGIAAAVGAGTGAVPPVEPDERVPTPGDLDELMVRLFAGRVGYRSLTSEVPEPDRNPRDVDVVVLDRAEILLVVGQIAPARVAAPNESLTFRIEVGFEAEQLAELGLNNADLARDVINRLLFVQANVVSVVTEERQAPAVTEVSVVDPAFIDRVDDGWTDLLGAIEVEPARFAIPGVDATIRLGQSYLELRREEITSGIEPPGGLVEQTELGPNDDPASDDPGD